MPMSAHHAQTPGGGLANAFISPVTLPDHGPWWSGDKLSWAFARQGPSWEVHACGHGCVRVCAFVRAEFHRPTAPPRRSVGWSGLSVSAVTTAQQTLASHLLPGEGRQSKAIQSAEEAGVAEGLGRVRGRAWGYPCTTGLGVPVHWWGRCGCGGKGLIISGSLWAHTLGHPPAYTSQKLEPVLEPAPDPQGHPVSVQDKG